MEEQEPAVEWKRHDGVPAHVVAAREEAAGIYARVHRVAGPRIDAHLTTLTMALDDLATKHQHVLEKTDLDLDGSTLALAVMGGQREKHRAQSRAHRARARRLRSGAPTHPASDARSQPAAARPAAFPDDKWRRRYLAGADVRRWQLREAEGQIQNHYDSEKRRGRSGRGSAEGRESRGLPSAVGGRPQPSLEHPRERVRPRSHRVDGSPPGPDCAGGLLVDAGHAIEETIIAVGGALTRFYGPKLGSRQ